MQKIFGDFLSGRAAVGLLILRVIAGLAMAQHGYGKMFHEDGPFNWMGPGMPGILQFLAALSEFGGGIALAFGFLTPLASFGIAATMVVAILKGHAGSPWVGKPEDRPFELAAFYLAATIAFILTGPGAISLDALIFGRSKRISAERLEKASDTTPI